MIFSIYLILSIVKFLMLICEHRNDILERIFKNREYDLKQLSEGFFYEMVARRISCFYLKLCLLSLQDIFQRI